MTKRSIAPQPLTLFDWIKQPRTGMYSINVNPGLLNLTHDMGAAIVLDALICNCDTNDCWIDMEAFAGMTRVEMQDTWIWTAMKRLEREGYIELQPYSRFIENQRFELRLTQKFFDEYNTIRMNNET